MTAHTVNYRPLTPDFWNDFEALFGTSGAYGGCWCMWWRIKRSDFESNKNAGNRRAMRALVHSGTIPGIIAYEDDQPVGWCAVAPRDELGSINRSHVLKRIDDQPVWSITCFYVAKTHRDCGLIENLIASAVEYVRKSGGDIVEAYPHTSTVKKLADVSSFMGFPEVFERQGFQAVRQASKSKLIMRRYLAMVCLVLIAFPVAGQPHQPSSLFNGKNLAGWVNYGTETWYAENGELVCESGPDAEYGYLATDEVFTDFDLSLEFLQETNGNSGVFFRSWVHGTTVEGWQVEIARPGGHTGGIYESYGRGWLIQPSPEKESLLKVGEWNTMRILAIGGRVRTWLNGVRMVDIMDELIGRAKGRIALQIHSGGGIKVRWRNIHITRL